MRILIIEDESEIRKLVKLNLEIDGYYVDEAEDGKEGMKLLNENQYDLVVLDIMLPYISGYEICSFIKSSSAATKVIIISANGEDKDKILGLKLGADDYLSKPFNLEELLLRIKNQLKNFIPAAVNVNISSFGSNKINFDSYTAETKDGVIQLTSKEAEFLKLLMENENSVVSRDEILNKVWGYDMFLSTRTMDNIIVGFRKKFEIDQKEPKHFITIRGVGYKFCK